MYNVARSDAATPRAVGGGQVSLVKGDGETGGRMRTVTSADDGRADVQAVTLDGRDPACVDGDELLDELEKLVGVEGWERDTARRGFHAFHVHVRAEESGLAIWTCVRL